MRPKMATRVSETDRGEKEESTKNMQTFRWAVIKFAMCLLLLHLLVVGQHKNVKNELLRSSPQGRVLARPQDMSDTNKQMM